MSNENAGLQTHQQDLDNASFVHQAYLRLLGRAADPDGLQDSVAKLDAGVPRSDVSTTLADSEEGQRYASRRNALRHGTGPVIAPTVQPPSQAVSRALAVAAVRHLSHVNELLVLDDAVFIAWAERHRPDLVRTPEPKPEVDKAAAKKVLVVPALAVDETGAAVTVDGEVVPGVTVTVRGPSFSVDFGEDG